MIWQATHSSILAWEILQTGETGRLQSMGLQRLRHNWSNGTQRTHSILFEHSPWGRVTWFTPILQITLAQISLTQFFPGYLILKWKLSHAPITAAAAAAAKSLQSWPTLCDPIDGSPPGSPIPGILQARTLEWVAISFSICVYDIFFIHLSMSGRLGCFRIFAIILLQWTWGHICLL